MSNEDATALNTSWTCKYTHRKVIRPHNAKAGPDNAVKDASNSRQARCTAKRTGVLPEAEAVLVAKRVTAAHGHQRVEGEADHEKHFCNRDPKLNLAKPADRVELDDAERDDACRDEDGGVEAVGPVFDDDVDGGKFKADEGELGNDELSDQLVGLSILCGIAKDLRSTQEPYRKKGGQSAQQQ